MQPTYGTFAGARADDLCWVRPRRICRARRASRPHQVKSGKYFQTHTRQICKACVNKSVNPPLPLRSESSMSKYFRQIFEPKFQDLLIFGCVYSPTRLLELPHFGSLKNLPIISVREILKAEHNVMRHFSTFINLNVICSYSA